MITKKLSKESRRTFCRPCILYPLSDECSRATPFRLINCSSTALSSHPNAIGVDHIAFTVGSYLYSEGGAPHWLVGQLADALDVPTRKSPGRWAARPGGRGFPCERGMDHGTTPQ